MELKFKIWDGKEPINGLEPARVREIYGTKPLMLFYKIEDSVERIEYENIIRSNYDLSYEEFPTIESVAQEYLRIEKEAQENAASEQEQTVTQLDNIQSQLDYIMMNFE